MTTPIKPLGPPPTPAPQRPGTVEASDVGEAAVPTTAAQMAESRPRPDLVKIIDETWEQFEEAYRYLGR